MNIVKEFNTEFYQQESYIEIINVALKMKLDNLFVEIKKMEQMEVINHKEKHLMIAKEIYKQRIQLVNEK
jgi:hypothetical protein